MDEPNYNITDSSGTVVGQIGVTSGGDPIVSKPGGGSVIVTDDGVEIPGDADVGGSLSTEKANIANVVGKLEATETQTVQPDTETKVQFGAVNISHTEVVDIDLENDKITIQEDGDYLITGNTFWEAVSGGVEYRVRPYRNGSVLSTGENRVATGAPLSRYSVQPSPSTFELSVSDEIELHTRHQEASSRDLAAGVSNLTVTKIG